MTLKTFTDIVGRRYHLAKKKRKKYCSKITFVSTLFEHVINTYVVLSFCQFIFFLCDFFLNLIIPRRIYPF